MAGITQAEVAVGKRYCVKIGSRLAEVEIVGISTMPRWRCHARTIDTRRTILVRGVQRLRPVASSPRGRAIVMSEAEVQAGLQRCLGRLLGDFLG